MPSFFQKLTRDAVLKDMRDKEMPAIDVFSRSIEYLICKEIPKKKFTNNYYAFKQIRYLGINSTSRLGRTC